MLFRSPGTLLDSTAGGVMGASYSSGKLIYSYGLTDKVSATGGRYQKVGPVWGRKDDDRLTTTGCASFDSSGALTLVGTGSLLENNLLDALNAWVSKNSGYRRWEAVSGGYPKMLPVTEITQADVTNGTLTFSTITETYTGSEIKPTPTIK